MENRRLSEPTVQYAYTKPAKDPKLRRWNPLGFKIVDFRPEREMLDDIKTTEMNTDIEGIAP